MGLAAIIGGSAMVAVYHDKASDNWKKLGNVNLLSTGAEALAAGYRKKLNDANGNVERQCEGWSGDPDGRGGCRPDRDIFCDLWLSEG